MSLSSFSPHRRIPAWSKRALLCGVALSCCLSLSAPAFAMDDDAVMAQLKTMQEQIGKLQGQVKALNGELKKAKAEAYAAKATAKTASATATAAKEAALEPSAGGKKHRGGLEVSSKDGETVLTNKGIKLTVGGFTEAAGILRSRNESADIASSWTGIPLPISSGSHLSEFRGTARQSRLSLLAEGEADANTKLSAYFETDFLGAAPTANSNESNSYNPRMRQVYATIDRSDGWHFLGGQAWSLLTVTKKGITPRQENAPMVIEAQYVPGFTWTRNPQFRIVKDMDDNKLAAGISFESPQAIVFNGPNTPAGGAPIYNIGGGSGFASTNSYTTDLAPDIIAKLAYDPGYGHYEVYGLARFFRDRTHVGGSNDTTIGGGGGAAAILPIVDKKLDFQISGLAGRGIGRYGSVQLPDVTIKPDGSLATVGEIAALAGLTAHPDSQWDLYLYSGIEQSMKQDFASGGNGFGYGSPLYNNSGCLTEGAAANTCVANTKAVAQVTAGAWWKFYKGSFGMMQTGLQDSFSKRYTFRGVGGAPSANENITMISFRYYPF